MTDLAPFDGQPASALEHDDSTFLFGDPCRNCGYDPPIDTPPDEYIECLAAMWRAG